MCVRVEEAVEETVEDMFGMGVRVNGGRREVVLENGGIDFGNLFQLDISSGRGCRI